MNLPDAPIAHEGFFATHFFAVSATTNRRTSTSEFLGEVIKPANPCHVKLANTWIILYPGAYPTPDKPEVLLETPS